MGQTLSEPVTSKETASCQNDSYKVGSSCMQGWRTSMEDSHTHILSLPDDNKASFFAVYDGHGGSNVAQYCSKHLHKFILKRPEYNSDLEEALKKGFLDADNAMLNDESLKEQMAGTTAITVLIKDEKIYCANAGDSRAIGCKNGEVESLSFDHKPNNPDEMDRIYRAGGYVELNRVNGNLALSRALGDFVFKKNKRFSAEQQIVTALPDVSVTDLNEDWIFIVLACDGIWDVVSNEEVNDFVLGSIAYGKYPEDICEQLLTFCLAPVCQMGGLGGDNMSVIIVCFLHGQPYENLVEKAKDLIKRRRNELAKEKKKKRIEEIEELTEHDRKIIESINSSTYLVYGDDKDLDDDVEKKPETEQPVDTPSSSSNSSPTKQSDSSTPEQEPKDADSDTKFEEAQPESDKMPQNVEQQSKKAKSDEQSDSSPVDLK